MRKNFVTVYNEHSPKKYLKLVKSVPFLVNSSARTYKPSYVCMWTGARYVFTNEELVYLKSKIQLLRRPQ